MATRNRKDVLARCLGEYAGQTHTDIEIVVADNGSTDGTLEMVAERFPHVITIRFEENVGPLALNAAAQAATGELLWRTDDDAYPDAATTIADAVTFMDQHPNVVVLSGEVRDASIGFEILDYYPFRKSSKSDPADGYPFYGFFGVCAMIRRSAFLEAGGFWDAFYCEEDELSIRLQLHGGEIRYVPSIVAVHLVEFSNKRAMDIRWQLQLVQTTRLQWKYWPWPAALYRSGVVALAMLLSGFFHRLPMRTIAEGYQKAFAAAMRARKTERIRVSYSRMRQITMYRSIWHHMFHHYWKRWQMRRKQT